MGNYSSEPVVEKETERSQDDTFHVAVSSCQGWRMSQEDNHTMMLELPGAHKASFFAVYDGHGSARVSKHASETLWHILSHNDNYEKGNFMEALQETFLTFDREVDESYNAQLAGTTAICTLIVNNTVYCANIGDSRAVACINCECLPLSADHKPENPQELKRIIAAGGYVMGNRVNGNLALSRAFGDFHYKGNERLPPNEQIVSPFPDIKAIELNEDLDFIVLACDGIWDVLSSEEVVEFVITRLEQNMEPGLICEQLTTRCLATEYELVIGCDNMTVLLACYTRGRSWDDYCKDIYNKNTKKNGAPRARVRVDDKSLEEAGFRETSAEKIDSEPSEKRDCVQQEVEKSDSQAETAPVQESSSSSKNNTTSCSKNNENTPSKSDECSGSQVDEQPETSSAEKKSEKVPDGSVRDSQQAEASDGKQHTNEASKTEATKMEPKEGEKEKEIEADLKELVKSNSGSEAVAETANEVCQKQAVKAEDLNKLEKIFSECKLSAGEAGDSAPE